MTYFDYKYTCPEIDVSIEAIKDEIRNNLVHMLGSITQYATIDDLVNAYTSNIYSSFDAHIEIIRETNSDIRDEANVQIRMKLDEIIELESELSQNYS